MGLIRTSFTSPHIGLKVLYLNGKEDRDKISRAGRGEDVQLEPLTSISDMVPLGPRFAKSV